MQKERSTQIIFCIDSEFSPVVTTFIKEATKQCLAMDQELGRLQPTIVTAILESGFRIDLLDDKIEEFIQLCQDVTAGGQEC